MINTQAWQDAQAAAAAQRPVVEDPQAAPPQAPEPQPPFEDFGDEDYKYMDPSPQYNPDEYNPEPDPFPGYDPNGYSPGPSLDGGFDDGGDAGVWGDHEGAAEVGEHVAEHVIVDKGVEVISEHGVPWLGPAGFAISTTIGLKDDCGGCTEVDPNTGLPKNQAPDDGPSSDPPIEITRDFQVDPNLFNKEMNAPAEPEYADTTMIPADGSYYTWETPISDDGARGEPGEGYWVDPTE